MGDLLRGFHRGGDAVDVGQFQAGVGDRVQRRVRMELDLRHVGNDAEFGGFGGADDGNLVLLRMMPSPLPDGTREG